MKLLLVTLGWILFGYSSVYGEDLLEKKEANVWPTCIAQFCFDKQAPKEDSLTQAYGKGIFRKGGEEAFHCYVVSSKKLFLKFIIHNDTPPFIDTILVSDMPVCAKAKQPTKPFKQLSTSEGLMVGDGYEKAIQLYGVPQYVRTGEELNVLIHDEFSSSGKKMYFNKAIAYGPRKKDDLLTTWLFFRNDRLAAILISISE